MATTYFLASLLWFTNSSAPQFHRAFQFPDAFPLVFSVTSVVSSFPWSTGEIILSQTRLIPLPLSSHHNVSLIWQNPNHLSTCCLHPNSRRLLEKTHICLSILTLILGLQISDGHLALETALSFCGKLSLTASQWLLHIFYFSKPPLPMLLSISLHCTLMKFYMESDVGRSTLSSHNHMF